MVYVNAKWIVLRLLLAFFIATVIIVLNLMSAVGLHTPKTGKSVELSKTIFRNVFVWFRDESCRFCFMGNHYACLEIICTANIVYTIQGK